MTFDANVLIDLRPFDKLLFPLISAHIGPIMVATTTLIEVQGFSIEDCKKLGISLIEPSIEQLFSAVKNSTPLSFSDWICLLLAEEKGWTCVTNDKALRWQCLERKLAVMWCLEILCLLVERKELSKIHCKKIIKSMQENNPFFITDAIVIQAFKRLDLLFP